LTCTSEKGEGSGRGVISVRQPLERSVFGCKGRITPESQCKAMNAHASGPLSQHTPVRCGNGCICEPPGQGCQVGAR
jgi:hypothetical protein